MSENTSNLATEAYIKFPSPRSTEGGFQFADSNFWTVGALSMLATAVHTTMAQSDFIHRYTLDPAVTCLTSGILLCRSLLARASENMRERRTYINDDPENRPEIVRERATATVAIFAIAKAINDRNYIILRLLSGELAKGHLHLCLKERKLCVANARARTSIHSRALDEMTAYIYSGTSRAFDIAYSAEHEKENPLD